METVLDLLVVISPLIFVVGLIMMFKQIELEIISTIFERR